jgi:hypothetical protein
MNNDDVLTPKPQNPNSMFKLNGSVCVKYSVPYPNEIDDL